MNIETIKNFYKHLKENQLPDNINQESQMSRGEKYTADIWTLQVCKCLIDNDCNHEHSIKSYTEHKYLMIETLEKIKNDADMICVGEVGRGLDILIANMLKKWKVICYDHNPVYGDYLNRYFNNVDFHPISTNGFMYNLDIVKEKSIFIIDNTLYRKFEILKNNKNIVHIIFNGKLLW